MPDKFVLLRAALAAAGVAAAALLLFSLPWRRPRRVLSTAGWALGVGGGCLLGCWVLAPSEPWPLNEDKGRFLLLLLPAAVASEILAAFLQRPRWLPWVPRLLVAGAAARLLLNNTKYIAELPGLSRDWTTTQIILILGGLAVTLAAVWFLLTLLAERTPSRSLPLVLALVSGGAAVTIMLSGYATGGQWGFPLAGALAGAAAASFILAGPLDVKGALGPGLVGLFGLLVIGLYFGELTPVNAVLLFAAPLLAWLPELPGLCRMPAWAQGVARILVVAAPMALAVLQAAANFEAASQAGNSPKESTPTTSSSPEPTAQDYEDFGKQPSPSVPSP